MQRSTGTNIGLAALVILLLAVGFFGYRFTQYGQVSTPAAGDAAKTDQKPPDAYKPRP
jgi:hypothetical protein